MGCNYSSAKIQFYDNDKSSKVFDNIFINIVWALITSWCHYTWLILYGFVAIAFGVVKGSQTLDTFSSMYQVVELSHIDILVYSIGFGLCNLYNTVVKCAWKSSNLLYSQNLFQSRFHGNTVCV